VKPVRGAGGMCARCLGFPVRLAVLVPAAALPLWAAVTEDGLCRGLSPHGFWCVEAKVEDAVAGYAGRMGPGKVRIPMPEPWPRGWR